MYHFQELKPIFSRLTDISLLASCGRGLTQNSNESLHSLVWSFVPKEQFNSPNEVQLGIDLGVLIYNVGREDALRRLMHAANLPPSSEVSIKALQDLDQRRLTNSMRRNAEEVKEKRKKERKGRLARLSAFKTVEGIHYSSGQFHGRCDASCSTVPDLWSAKEGPPPRGLPIGKMWSWCYGCYFCTELGCYDELRCLM